jgi:hypothetical protein
MKDNMKKMIRDKLAENRAQAEAALPFHKRWFAKIIRWINNSETTVIVVAMCIIWPLALLPAFLFWFLWSLLNPVTFWQTFVTLVFIGGPLLIPQIFLLALALALTFGLIAEVFDN